MDDVFMPVFDIEFPPQNFFFRGSPNRKLRVDLDDGLSSREYEVGGMIPPRFHRGLIINQ